MVIFKTLYQHQYDLKVWITDPRGKDPSFEKEIVLIQVKQLHHAVEYVCSISDVYLSFFFYREHDPDGEAEYF